jgi:uncharacterized membrane protein
MKLTNKETDWINTKLSSYDIKFQEIFDELKDHLITAIENLREQGDDRHVEVLFNEVVSAQFPGFWPFDDIAKQYRLAYQHKISKALWANFNHYLNWKTMPALLALLVVGFYLPHSKAAVTTIMGILLIAAIVPMLYSYFTGRKIKTDKGRQSLLKNYVRFQSNFLVLISNVVFNLIGGLARNWAPASFLSPMHYAPVFFMLMIGFFCIYGMSCIRLTRQQFKLED